MRLSTASKIPGQVLSGTQVLDMTSIFSLALRVITGDTQSARVTLSTRVTSSIGSSSFISCSLLELFAFLESSHRGQDGGRSSKTTSHGGRPNTKGK